MAEDICTSEDLTDDSHHNPDESHFPVSNQENGMKVTIDQEDSHKPIQRFAQQHRDSRIDEHVTVRPAVHEFGSQKTLHERPVADAIEAFGVTSLGVDSTVVNGAGQRQEEPPVTLTDRKGSGRQVHTQESEQESDHSQQAKRVRDHGAESALHFFRGSAPSRLHQSSSLPSTKNLLLPNPTVSRSISGPVCGITKLSVPSENGFAHFLCLVEEDCSVDMASSSETVQHGCNMYAMPITGGE